MTQKGPWDMVPSDYQSFQHLAALARRAVESMLGPSEQAAAAAEQEQRYQQQVAAWEGGGALGDFPTRPSPARPMTAEELDQWLVHKVQQKLLDKLDHVLLDMVGLERENWGSGYRLKPGGLASPLRTKLEDKVKSIASAIADSWAEKNKDFTAPKDIKVEFRYELERATRVAIEERIKKIAAERANEIKVEVLAAAVDKAMYDMYPILARAEAVRRLGGKEGGTP